MSRRKVMEMLGVGGAAALAGCTGDGGDGGGGDGGDGGGGDGGGGDGGGGGVMQEAKKIKWGENWKDRRLASFDKWSKEDRTAVPEPGSDAIISKDGWKDSQSLQSAPWEPPEGWKDTPAADVDSIQILNHGSLDFDLATVATFSLFEERTGITIEPLEIVVDQAIPKKAAFFSAGAEQPHGTDIVVLSSFSSFVQNGYLAETRVQPKEEMWEPYIPMTKQSFQLDGTTYFGPNINQGGLVHTRPQMMLDQGVSQETVDRITGGEWTWADLEKVGEAFKGTDVSAWAYRGSSLVYTFRDWQKLYYQAGGSFVQDNGTVKVNNEAGLIALQKMIEWLDKGYVPDAVTSFTQGDLADGFLSGQFAMVPVFGDLIKRAVAEFGKEPEYAATLPMKGSDEAPNPSRVTIASPNGMGINNFSSTGHKLAMMLYQDCRFSVAPNWWEYVDEGNSAYLRSVFEAAAEEGVADFSSVRGESIANAKVETWPQQRATSQRLSEELQAAIAGEKEPQAALDTAQQFFNTVLGQDA